MKKLDGRRLSRKTQEDIRLRTVARVRAGESPEVLAKALGFSRSAIYKWLSDYANGGKKALAAKPTPGKPSRLNTEHLRWIYKVVVGKNPLQLKLPFALWTRSQLIIAIKRKFGIEVGKTVLSRALEKLGLSFQRPLTRLHQQDPVIVQKWLEKDYPAIKKEAKAVGAEIFFGDESGLRSDYRLGKTLGARGQTPVLSRTSARFKLNMISAVSGTGSLRFMVTEKTVNGAVFIEFLKRLSHGARKPIFLIVDNHPIHKTKAVEEFVQKTDGKLKLFFLPPYSPDMNPDEMVWRQVKQHEVQRNLYDNQTALKQAVFKSLHRLQKCKDTLLSFFKTPTTVYASI